MAEVARGEGLLGFLQNLCGLNVETKPNHWPNCFLSKMAKSPKFLLAMYTNGHCMLLICAISMLVMYDCMYTLRLATIHERAF